MKELKNRLSWYLRLVKDGEVVLVTDRGRVIAELREPESEEEGANTALQELVRRGEAVAGVPPRPGSYPRLGIRMSLEDVQELLDATRGEQ